MCVCKKCVRFFKYTDRGGPTPIKWQGEWSHGWVKKSSIRFWWVVCCCTLYVVVVCVGVCRMCVVHTCVWHMCVTRVCDTCVWHVCVTRVCVEAEESFEQRRIYAVCFPPRTHMFTFGNIRSNTRTLGFLLHLSLEFPYLLFYPPHRNRTFMFRASMSSYGFVL